MALSESPAERHREVAGLFHDVAVQISDWGAPSPVQGWNTRDVVRHLIDWFPAFLEMATDIELPVGPSVDDDPVGAWDAQSAAVQELLDDPASRTKVMSDPKIGGEFLLPNGIDMFYTGDVFMHTWDLATAGGVDIALDADHCELLLNGLEPMDEMLRASGQYGPKVEVRTDADAQSKLMAFIGRDPDRTA